MADPRFLETARRIGHVYYSRLVLQGLDVRQEPLGANPMTNISRLEGFMSTILGPMDPRDFLNTFFERWAKIYGKLQGRKKIARPYGEVPPTAPYREFIVNPLVSRFHRIFQLLLSSHATASHPLFLHDKGQDFEPRVHIWLPLVREHRLL